MEEWGAEEQAALAVFDVTQHWFSKTRAGSPDAQIGVWVASGAMP